MTVDPLRSDRLQPGWLMFLDCSPAVRVWSGAANFKLGASGPDLAGGIYQGLGLLVGVPTLKIPLNGSFSQHVFSLSGVTAQMMKLVDADRETVTGAKLSWGRLELDAQMQPVGAPVWLWKGTVDSPRLARDGGANPPTRTVSLVASTGAVTRKRQKISLWTGPQQRLIDPDDAACDGVARLAEGTDEIWPN